MAISNTTIETINYAQDLQIEYTIKAILLFLFATVCVLSIWYAKKMKQESYISELSYKILISMGYVGLFNLPLIIVIFQRGVTLDFLINILFEVYTIFALILGAFLLFKVFEYFLEKYFNYKLAGNNKKPGRDSSEYRRSG